ncbi:MAG: hypothetical protein ABEH66_04400 [Halobacteriales archaeon]
MARRLSRRDALRVGSLAASAGAAGCLGVGSLLAPSPEKQVENHASALEPLADVSTAIAKGYRTAGTYVRTDAGVVGEPFVNLEVEELNPEKPQAVLYTLTEEGTYEAVGLKWFVPASDYDSPPSLFGKTFSGPHESEAALVPEHYALHVWLYRENPEGLFARYNPALTPPALVDRIAPVREALSAFRVGAEAKKNGYTNTEKCATTEGGPYGVAFVRDGTDGSGGTDPEKPPVLLYRLTDSWTYQLMGAEWYVPAAEADGAPTMFGRTFHESMPGHSPKTNQPDHYGLHAWLFKANPGGMFAPFNPTVSCG